VQTPYDRYRLVKKILQGKSTIKLKYQVNSFSVALPNRIVAGWQTRSKKGRLGSPERKAERERETRNCADLHDGHV
jgi:hypothetical protein